MYINDDAEAVGSATIMWKIIVSYICNDVVCNMLWQTAGILLVELHRSSPMLHATTEGSDTDLLLRVLLRGSHRAQVSPEPV